MVKNPPAKEGDMGDLGSIPQSGRSPGGGHGNPLQHHHLLLLKSIPPSFSVEGTLPTPGTQLETWISFLSLSSLPTSNLKIPLFCFLYISGICPLLYSISFLLLWFAWALVCMGSGLHGLSQCLFWGRSRQIFVLPDFMISVPLQGIGTWLPAV